MKSGETPALSRNGKVRALLSVNKYVFELSEAEMKSKVRAAAFAAAIYSIAGSPGKAQDVIVEATQIQEEKVEPSRSMTVIALDRNHLAKLQTVADILRQVPGIEVVRQGTVGQTTSVFIRGARSEDTLVLIDGTEANDAMAPASGFDFSIMAADNIERIEVFRGPQSVRFGAGALGGVINIVTKEGQGLRRSQYLLEAGSYSTQRETVSTRGTVDRWRYSTSIGHNSTKGFSAASESTGNTEPDGANAISGSAKVGWNPSETAKIESAVRYTEAEIEIDTQGGRGGDDPNNKTNAKQLATSIVGTERFLSQQLKGSLGLHFSELDRRTRNLPDAGRTTDSSDHFLSETRKAQSDWELALGEIHTLRWGLSFRDESGRSNSMFDGTPTAISGKSQSIAGESVTYLFESPTWFFDLGVRSDHTSKVGTISSFRASLGRNFSSGTKAFTSWGTGYKLPSLYQLYSTYGDENLKQETSTTIEATIEQRIDQNATMALTAFENSFRDMIDFNTTTNRYFNLSKSRSRGAELQTVFKIFPRLDFSGSYTYLNSEDENTGLKLIRRPQDVIAASAIYRTDDFELGARYTFRGTRDDIDPNTYQRMKMDAYSLFAIGGTYTIQPWLKTHARIENLFDSKYEEVAGYTTSGRSVFAGLSGEF